MPAFVIVWIGQAVSLLGTNMTIFGLTIWVYKGTGSATALALVEFFYLTPMLILSPTAGAIVDRFNRKFMMMVSDLTAGLTTIVLLGLYLSGSLQVWHLYVGAAIEGAFQTFQWPAYSAAITTMLPKQHYSRADGMMSLAESGSGIFAPLLAGALLGVVGLAGILLIDIITFVIAIGALLLIHVPQPRATQEGLAGQGSLWQESVFGFRYILQRPSLLGLQVVFLIGNFLTSIPYAILAPLILARTAGSELIYGSVNSIGAIGGVVGGVVMSLWGGPKRRVHGVLGGWLASSLLGVTLLGLGRSLPVWAVASFLGSFFNPLINSSNQSIWQSKVAPDVQGRVFSIRRLIAWLVNPLAVLIAGPLADLVMEPAMRQGGVLTGVFGWLVGIGPGAGISLIFVFTGSLAAIASLSGYLVRIVRQVEDILPDHDVLPACQAERRVRLEELMKERQRLIAGEQVPERERGLKHISHELRELGRETLTPDPADSN